MKPQHLLFLLLLSLPTSLFAQQPAPDLSLTVNGGQDLSLYPGWPLIAHATIMNSQRFSPSVTSGPLVIAPNGETWTSALQFTAVSASGQTFQWPLKLIGTPASAALSLLSNSYVRVTFQMSGTDVAALLPGTYQLTASLQASNSTGWNGIVQSSPVAIQIGPEPVLTADQQTEKALLIAQYQTNGGDLDGALSTVQQFLTAQPGDPSAMSAEANLLELQGYTGLAFFQAHDALSAYFTANPSLYDPPSNLLTMYQRLFTKMTTPGPALATTTSASSASSTFSPASRVVTLSATVLGASGPVDGGTVTFTVSKIGSPVTSTAFTQGAASAAFTIPAGTTAGIYSIQAVYNGTSVFSPSTDASQSLTISKAMPTINWNDPASVPAGTALGPSQLNAMASVPGTFVYNPPAGTVMTGSSTQTLNVTFTPADSTDYFSAIATVMITITPSPCASNLTASVAVTRSGFSYSPLLKRYAQTLTLTNTSGSTITGPIYVILDNLSTGAALYNAGGSTACAAPTGSPYTSIAGPIGAGASTNVVLQFSDPTNAAISYTTRFLAGTGQP